jgi:uncharacterized membrane-anchored protein YitT (DUF2179 family)
MVKVTPKPKHQYLKNAIWMTIGAFLAALSIQVFLYPNKLIDGGVIGISLIFAQITKSFYLPYYLIIFNIPFIYLAYRFIRKSFVIQMLFAIILFAIFLAILEKIPSFDADMLEVIVFGGAILGIGVGLIIRNGGCTDGTEILAIIISRKKGYTVGQIVLFINFFIFGAYGLIFKDWHIALQSLMTYFVAFKMMDLVISGLDEMKSIMIMTNKPDKLRKIIMQELGLGLTIIKSKGGFTNEDREILFVIVERLDLAELKELVLSNDPKAFMAIENLHEVAYGQREKLLLRKRKS